VRYTILVKTKTPQIQHLETVRNEADVTRLGDIVEVVERAIKAESLLPGRVAHELFRLSLLQALQQWQGCPTQKAVLLNLNDGSYVQEEIHG